MPRAQCTKNQPPIAGSIQWSRALMRRIKKPMLRFQSYEEIMNSSEGQNATKIYISVGKAMREYENKLEKEFLDSVERQAMGNLKENILRIDGDKITVNFSKQVPVRAAMPCAPPGGDVTRAFLRYGLSTI